MSMGYAKYLLHSFEWIDAASTDGDGVHTNYIPKYCPDQMPLETLRSDLQIRWCCGPLL